MMGLAGVSAASDLFIKADTAVGGFIHARPEVRWGVVVGLVLLGYSLLREARRRRSRLRRPSAIVPRNTNPDHLVGRDDHVRTLAGHCARERLVFVTGESGVGKSAFVRAGLMPELMKVKPPEFVPVYFDNWGKDWVTGPADHLAQAVFRELRELPVGLAEVPSLAQIAPLFSAVRRQLGRTPLLVFDQFDEYQARHESLLLKDGAWLKPRELCHRNQFWSTISDLIVRDLATCIFVTRKDKAEALNLVRFVEPCTFPLPAVDKGETEEALTRLTASHGAEGEIVEYPQAGWEQLRHRLAADLSRSGSLHPSQLSLATRALAKLPYLTLTEYNAVGGLDGLIANFVAERAKLVGQQAGASEDAVFSLLAPFLNEGGTATRELDRAEVVGSDPKHEAVLRSLEQDIIRVRGEGAGRRVMLFHDALAPAVRDAIGRRQALTDELSRRRLAFETASGAFSHWRTLLPLRLQARVLRDRAARKAYLATPAYAVLGLLRLLPVSALFVVLLLTGLRMRRDRAVAAVLDQCFAAGSSTTDCTAALTRATPEVRFSAFQLAWPASERLGESFGRDPWPPDLPDRSGFVGSLLVPCALGVAPWVFMWDFHTGIPILGMGRLEAAAARCARKAMAMTQDPVAVAQALLPNLLSYDADTALQVLSDLPADASSKTWSVASFTTPPVAPPQPWSRPRHAFQSDITIAAQQEPEDAGNPREPKGPSRPDLGRDRLLDVMTEIGDPWTTIEVWRSMGKLGVRSTDARRIQESLVATSPGPYRGDFYLLSQFPAIRAASPDHGDFTAPALHFIDGYTPSSEVDKWAWTALLCDLDVPKERLPFALDLTFHDPLKLAEDGVHGPAFVWSEFPLMALVRAVTCAEPARDGDTVEGLTEALMRTVRTRSRSQGLYEGFGDGARQPSDVSRAFVALWPWLSERRRWEVFQQHVDALQDSSLAASLDGSLDVIGAAFAGTANEVDRTRACTAIRKAIGEASYGDELAPLAEAARRLCDGHADTELLAGLVSASRIDAGEAFTVLSSIGESARCSNPCLAFEIPNLEPVRSWGDPTAALALGSLCDKPHTCLGAPKFINEVSPMSFAAYAPEPTAFWEKRENLPEVARMIVGLSQKVPAEARATLVRSLLGPSLSFPQALRARLAVRPALLAALCGLGADIVTQRLEESSPASPDLSCPSMPGGVLPSPFAPSIGVAASIAP
jgi:hypothetical protein